MRGILRELQTDGADVTVVDMEAGLEHLKRGTPRHTDTLLVVAEPYYRSLETGTRTATMGRELGIPNVWIVGNKVRDDEDERMVRTIFEQHQLDVLGMVPFDESAVEADRIPAALIDVKPDAPAVLAVALIADRVAG